MSKNLFYSRTMSIKKMISDVREKEGKVSGSQNPQKFNTDILYNILDSSKKEAMEVKNKISIEIHCVQKYCQIKYRHS